MVPVVQFLFSATSAELLHEMVRFPEDSIAWFPDSATILCLPHVDGYLAAFLPSLWFPRENLTVEIGGCTFEQIFHSLHNNETMIVNLTSAAHPQTRVHLEMVVDSHLLPLHVKGELLIAGEGSHQSFSWTMDRLNVRSPSAAPIFTEAYQKWQLHEAATRQAFQSVSLTDGPDVLFFPPSKSNDARFNLTSAVEATLAHPNFATWHAQYRGALMLNHLTWGRQDFFALYAGAAGQFHKVDPFAQVMNRSAMWIPCVQRFGVSPDAAADSSRRCVALDERSSSAQNQTFSPIPNSHAGSVLIADTLTKHDPNFIIPSEAALALVDKVLNSTQTPDLVGWYAVGQGDTTFESASYTWFIHVGCWPIRDPPSSFFAIDARTGLLQYGFWNSHRRHPDTESPAAGSGDCYYRGPLPPI